IMGCFGVKTTAKPGWRSGRGWKCRRSVPRDNKRRLRATMAEATDQTRATISVKVKGQSVGDITLRFFPDVAPNHVKNFITLAKQKFYDGTTFHRVISGFMIQGGDPNSRNPDRATHGMGGPDHRVKAEFNSRPHKRGTLSMARANDPDSAGSQFFICVADSNFLDWQYTAFGEVVTGMDVADKIVAMKKDSRDNPLERAELTITVTE